MISFLEPYNCLQKRITSELNNPTMIDILYNLFFKMERFCYILGCEVNFKVTRRKELKCCIFSRYCESVGDFSR